MKSFTHLSVVSKVLEKEQDILFAYLFGSYAKVLRHGKLLFSRNEKKRIEFETSSLDQYFDFKPHLDRY